MEIFRIQFEFLSIRIFITYIGMFNLTKTLKNKVALRDDSSEQKESNQIDLAKQGDKSSDKGLNAPFKLVFKNSDDKPDQNNFFKQPHESLKINDFKARNTANVEDTSQSQSMEINYRQNNQDQYQSDASSKSMVSIRSNAKAKSHQPKKARISLTVPQQAAPRFKNSRTGIDKSKFSIDQKNLSNLSQKHRQTTQITKALKSDLAISVQKEKIKQKFQVTYLGKYSQQKFNQQAKLQNHRRKGTMMKRDTVALLADIQRDPAKLQPCQHESHSHSNSDMSSRQSDASSIPQELQLNQEAYDFDHKTSFDIKDLSSLEEAEIDQNLVENFMLQRIEQKNESMKQRIENHSKVFGYVKQNTIENLQKRLNDFQTKIQQKSKDEKYTAQMRQNDRQYIDSLEEQLELMEQETKLLSQKTQDIEQIQFQEELNEDIDPFAEFLRQDDNNSNGGNKEERQIKVPIINHENYDKINQMKMNVDYLDKQQNREKIQKTLIAKEHQQEIIESQMYAKHLKKVKFTINQNTVYFKIWNILILVNCLISTVMYPYFMIQDVENLIDLFLWQQIYCESLFFINIIVNFFKQELNEDGTSKSEPWTKVAAGYLYSRDFKLDLIAFIPWGYMGYLNPNFSFMWFLKIVRLKSLNYYMSNEVILQPVEMYITMRQEKCLQDPWRRRDINQDSIFITEKIYYRYTLKMFRLVMQVFIIAYLVGQYWFVFCVSMATKSESPTSHESIAHGDNRRMLVDDIQYHDSFIYNDSWNLIRQEMVRKSLITLYFAFTSLSTVGFGDFYPINEYERLVGSFILLAGVAAFSYILGELLANMEQMNCLLSDEQDDRELERFFSTLRFYNNNFPIDKDFQNEVRQFLKTRWLKNKNNFIAQEKDLMLYQQLPTECQMTIYTEFLFKEFLYKFRRFFNFRQTDYLEQLKESSNFGTKQSDNKHSVHKTENFGKIQNTVKKFMIGKKMGKMLSKLDELKQNTTEELVQLDNKKQQLSSQQRNASIKEKINEGIKKEYDDKKKEEIEKRKDEIEQTEKHLTDLIEEKRKEQFKLYAERQISELKAGIKFPFYTFQDDEFAAFVTQLLHCLQFRQYHPLEIIQQELDQCLELLFVEKGKYDIGYEMNKKKMYRRQFGPSTIIGGFQMCFEQRNRFVIRAHTEMQCYAILKKDWNQLLDDFPKFKEQIQQKLLNFYYQEIFRPLNKQKNKDIKSFLNRNDFDQILTLHESRETFYKRYFVDLKVEDTAQEYMRLQNDQQKIMMLLKKLEDKLNKFFQESKNITKHTFEVSSMLQNEVIRLLRNDKTILVDGQELSNYNLVNEIYQNVTTIQQQLKIKRMEKKTLQECKFEKKTRKLKNSIIAKKKFETFIKDKQSQVFGTAIDVATGNECKSKLQRQILVKNVDKAVSQALQKAQTRKRQLATSVVTQMLGQNIEEQNQIQEENDEAASSFGLKTDSDMKSSFASNDEQPQFNSQRTANEESIEQIQSTNQINTNNNQEHNRNTQSENRINNFAIVIEDLVQPEDQPSNNPFRTVKKSSQNQIIFYPDQNQEPNESDQPEDQAVDQNEFPAESTSIQQQDKSSNRQQEESIPIMQEDSSIPIVQEDSTPIVNVQEISTNDIGKTITFVAEPEESLKKKKAASKGKTKKGKKQVNKKIN